ncbi:hypothetical protein AMTR_s00020p00248830 [Amborella trichopoda]|uniref:Uncharacterized protein n=1 Tax=Amborella trichopoda TaxID=13333 RepID=W1PW29_AMBTC|nr:hypothetical protein AMTR_s00020p00248830 [Amborella trichopoda]
MRLTEYESEGLVSWKEGSSRLEPRVQVQLDLCVRVACAIGLKLRLMEFGSIHWREGHVHWGWHMAKKGLIRSAGEISKSTRKARVKGKRCCA